MLKFGGSSVGDAAMMRLVGEIVTAALPRSPLVVLSAMAGTTNALFAAAGEAQRGDRKSAIREARAIAENHRGVAEALFEGSVPAELDAALEARFDELELLLRGVALLQELSPRSMDAIASFGERLSTEVFAAYLASTGVRTELLDARSFVRTDGAFGEARPQPAAIRELAARLVAPHLGPDRAVVTQGYIGSNADGVTTTLGRGGSDYTASLLGAALDAEEVQIWTDVEGMLTCDPRVVPDAVSIRELSFAEAAELAVFGAKVLHPATIQPAVEAGILVTVRQTRKPDGRFTSVREKVSDRDPALALASRAGITVLTISSNRMLDQSGFLARIFEIFGRHGVSVDLVATAEVSLSLTVDDDAPLDAVLAELGSFATVRQSEGRAIIAVVGEHIRDTPGLGGRLFSAISDVNVEMISMGANEINLSLVVKAEDAPRALRQLHGVVVGSR